jgi:putative membrane protein
VKSLLVTWVTNGVALAVAAWLLPGIHIGEPYWQSLIIVSAIFGVVNALIKPVVTLLTCPAVILTLGLFTLIINAGMLMLSSWIARQLENAFTVDSLLWAVLGGVVTGVTSAVVHSVLKAD